MTSDERTVLSALELLDTGTEQPIRVWAFKLIIDRIEGLRNEIRLRDEAITRLEAEFDATCNAEELRQVREDNTRLHDQVSAAALYVQEALRRQKEAEARMLDGTDHLYLKEMVDRLQAEVVNLTEQIGLRDEACTDLEAKLQAAELEVTRACDHVGCTAAIIRRDDGTRVCAAGHPSRWVERSEFDASQAEVARLTGCLETANSHHEHFEREWYLRVDRIEELEQSIGLLTTLAPTMEMDSSNPMSMARTIETVVRTRIAELEAGLRDLLNYAEKQTCLHEETHRAGAIWEICDMCGRKWADDRGGKPEYEEPEAFTKAHALLGGEGK